MSNSITLCYANREYTLSAKRKLNYLDSDVVEASREIFVNDILLWPDMRISDFKEIQRKKYKESNLGLSQKQFLSKAIMDEVGVSWDDFVEDLKVKIHSCWEDHFVKKGMFIRAQEDFNQIVMAADSGHVASMYCIGTYYSDKGHVDAVDWLVKAHNRGHVGGCYELAIFFSKQGEHLNALKCLIISADKGNDTALMTVFHSSLINLMIKIQDIEALKLTLDELISYTKYSTARYFKAAFLLLNGLKQDAINLIDKMIKFPQNGLSDGEACEVMENQNLLIRDHLEKLNRSIKINNDNPFKYLMDDTNVNQFIRFSDYTDLSDIVLDKLKALS